MASGTKIIMSFVVSHLNFKELPLFFKLCEDIGVDGINVVEVENWFIPGQKKYLEQKEFINQAREVKKEIERFVKEYRGKLNICFLSSKKRKGICYWPFTRAFITVDGFVTPCCIRMDPDVINFGNIFDTSFESIWNSQKYKNFRKTMVKTSLFNPVCDQCPD
ncbi:MAG: SPASM domain-containing protein [Candidatus Omnitrophica bacterium]|nr:SPASM domain-containing protein [Candidatus Omnitrophota bacterium]MCM8831913.1 SPASM domain-containing protein [Candidatus Omnitrophota bacterium]